MFYAIVNDTKISIIWSRMLQNQNSVWKNKQNKEWCDVEEPATRNVAIVHLYNSACASNALKS